MDIQRKNFHHLIPLAERFLREDMDAPLSWVLTLIREPSFERFERFDVMWDRQDVFEGRYRYWDLPSDMERMDQYYDGLAGQERLRERYKPREWSPTLGQQRTELPVAAARALLDSLKTSQIMFPVANHNHVMLDGTHLILTIRGGTSLQVTVEWDEGQHLELDQLAEAVQSLFLALQEGEQYT